MCELAVELLQGSMREISYQFNQKIRGLVSKTLPLFTENRYEHLQIDEDLTVRAFSSEKRDFMDLEEISSGTQTADHAGGASGAFAGVGRTGGQGQSVSVSR